MQTQGQEGGWLPCFSPGTQQHLLRGPWEGNEEVFHLTDTGSFLLTPPTPHESKELLL